jgi:hypothetical protein
MSRHVILAITGMACIAVGACARDTGVITLGPDTYRVQAGRGLILGGAMEAERSAFAQGQAYCAAQNRQFVAVATNKPDVTQFEVDFRCLRAGDKDLVRPTLVPPPNVVIQDKR